MPDVRRGAERRRAPGGRVSPRPQCHIPCNVTSAAGRCRIAWEHSRSGAPHRRHANGHPKGRGTGHGTGHDGRAACRVVALTAHVAFRRDLDRLEAAASSGKGGAAHVRAGWENLTRQFRLHHDLQERVLWPRVRRAADRADGRAVLARTAPSTPSRRALGEVDAAMRDGAGLPGAVETCGGPGSPAARR